MCDQDPGLFTSSIAAIVNPRKASSEANRREVAGEIRAGWTEVTGSGVN